MSVPQSCLCAIPILHFKFPKFTKIKLRNHCTCIALRGVVTSVLQESQGLTVNTLVMLLLAMIALHMLTFRLMVTIVAEFCSLIIIHNNIAGRDNDQ